MILIHEIYQDPYYILTLDEFHKIPAGTELLDQRGNPINKPEEDHPYWFKINGKKATKYSWNYMLVKNQGLENMFMCFLLGS